MNQSDFVSKALSLAADVILVQDREGLCLYASAAVETALGYPPERFIGQSVYHCQHPDDRPVALRAVAAAIESASRIYSFESRYAHAEGTWPWFRVTGRVIIDSTTGLLSGFVVSLRPRESDLALTRDLELARAVMSASGDGYYEIDMVKGEVWLSPSWKAMFGFDDHELPNSADTVMGRRLAPGGPTTIQTFVETYFGPDNNFERTFRLRHKLGHVVVVESHGLVTRNDKGQPLRVIGSNRDVTKPFELQAALEAREERLRQASALARIAFLVFDAEGGACLSGAEDLAALTGLDVEDITKRGRAALTYRLVEPALATYLQTIADARAGLKNYAADLAITGSDGEIVYLQELGRFEADEDGKAIRAIAAIQDITESRRHAMELAASRDRLAAQTDELKTLARDLTLARNEAEAASRAISQFLATMSHELRTPLNAILGFAEIIGKEMLGPNGQPRYKEYANDIYASGRHLLSILNDILDLAKIEAGRLDLTLDWVVVADLVEDVTRLMSGPANAKSLTLTTSLKDLTTVYVDQRAMKQVLINLVSNAIKFTQAGGTITIASRALGAERVELSVSDTGIGIPADRIERVFEPFEQLDNNFAREQGGTGLGLTLVRAMVERHGGAVSIRSDVGKGTVVRIILPHPTDLHFD